MFNTILEIKLRMDLSPVTLYTSSPSVRQYCQDPTGQRDEANEVWERELNKVIRFKERSVQKLLCLSQRCLEDVHSVYTQYKMS